MCARASMRDVCGAASTGRHSSFRIRRATVRTRGRPSLFLWLASRSRFNDAGRQSRATQLPAPAMTTAAAKVFLLFFFFLGDFLFQRLDDIFESRESSSGRRLRYRLVFALDSKIVLFFFFCHVSIIIIFLVPSDDDGREREFDRVRDFDVVVEVFRFWVVQHVHVERFGRVEAVASRERARERWFG